MNVVSTFPQKEKERYSLICLHRKHDKKVYGDAARMNPMNDNFAMDVYSCQISCLRFVFQEGWLLKW